MTTTQASDAGVPAVELRKLAQRGALERLGHGVYRHCGVPTDRWTEFAFALANVGDAAFLEGDTVLAMFDLALVNPARIYVGTTQRCRRRQPGQIKVTYRPLMSEEDLTTHEGVRCVTVHRALLDGVDRLLPDRIAEAADEASQRNLISDRERSQVLEATTRRRLAGRKRLDGTVTEPDVDT